MHTETESVAGAGVHEGSSDVTQSEVGGAREPADQTQSSPGDARASVEELQLTPAGTLVLEGAESQAAAGAVNEMQAIRVKLMALQSSVELLRTELEGLHESLGAVTDSIDEIKTVLNGEAYAAADAAEADEPAEADTVLASVEEQVCTPRVRACLELLAAQVQAIGGDVATVKRVQSTLDGCAAGG